MKIAERGVRERKREMFRFMNDRNLNCFSSSRCGKMRRRRKKRQERREKGEEGEERAKFSFLLINPNTLWYRPWCERDEKSVRAMEGKAKSERRRRGGGERDGGGEGGGS